MSALDTQVTFDVAPEFTPWEIKMTAADAASLENLVATTLDPEATVTFCNQCPTGCDVDCTHSQRIQVLAIGNLRVQPLAA